jgi:peroxiredoxin
MVRKLPRAMTGKGHDRPTRQRADLLAHWIWRGLTVLVFAGVLALCLAPASDRLACRFPDSSGSMVSLADVGYRGKVVVITLGGAWCLNCHDEAGFLAAHARAQAPRGLEIIGLHFEFGDDPAHAFRQIDSFKARYGIGYPLLLAGQPTPESTKTALGALGPVKVYPSTICIGREGRVREVHIGRAGPAIGSSAIST